MTIPEFSQDTVYQSTSGPLPLAYPPSRSKLAIDYYDAAVHEFRLEPANLNRAKNTGAHYTQTNFIGATRCSASKAFLDPIKFRSNLYIFKNIFAIKLLFSGESRRRATGVTCVTNGKEYNVYEIKEVILAAGAIETAKLLMLFGVGPKQHLQQLGIPLLMDLPVGQELIDSTIVNIDFEANTKRVRHVSIGVAERTHLDVECISEC